MLIDSLKYQHKEFRQYSEYWQMLTAITEGGDKITDYWKKKLLPNPDGRPDSIIQERIKLSTYCNKIAPILWKFNSELFKKPAVPVGSSDPFWSEEFFPTGALLECDNDGRSSLNNLLQNAMMNALCTGQAIAQIDTKKGTGATSLAQQKESGELSPYVVLHHRSAMWDWDSSGRNGYNFVKLHQFKLVRESWHSKPKPQHIFTIYFRDESQKILTSKYIVHRIAKEEEPVPETPFIFTCQPKEMRVEPIIENEVIFNINNIFEFPVVSMELPRNLWMASQLFECQRSYFAQTAALEYALYTNNFSMPIITGVDDSSDDPIQNRKLGDGYYLTLKTGQNITSLERSTTSVQNAIAYRAEIKRDIYDIVQQIAMSASDGVSVVGRSGLSKQEDRRAEEILLERYGTIVKDFLSKILKVAAIAHGETVQWEITGYDDFTGFSLEELLQDLQNIKLSNIPSPTFNQEIYKHFVKRVARVYDLNPQAIDLAIEEINNLSLASFGNNDVDIEKQI